jgi:hypothetical protein
MRGSAGQRLPVLKHQIRFLQAAISLALDLELPGDILEDFRQQPRLNHHLGFREAAQTDFGSADLLHYSGQVADGAQPSHALDHRVEHSKQE